MFKQAITVAIIISAGGLASAATMTGGFGTMPQDAVVFSHDENDGGYDASTQGSPSLIGQRFILEADVSLAKISLRINKVGKQPDDLNLAVFTADNWNDNTTYVAVGSEDISGIESLLSGYDSEQPWYSFSFAIPVPLVAGVEYGIGLDTGENTVVGDLFEVSKDKSGSGGPGYDLSAIENNEMDATNDIGGIVLHAVPEPVSIAFLGVGGLLIAIRRRHPC